MSITRVGTNKKYAQGWDKAFGGKKSRRAPGAKPAKATAGKRTAGKAATSSRKKSAKKR